MIKSILHSSLLISELQQSRQFYEDTLGMELDLSRPELGYPGLWFKAGLQQIHLLLLPDPERGRERERPEHGGRDRHIAMAVTDIKKLEQRLQQARVDVTKSRSGRAAIFCRDPDGNALEFVEEK